MVITLKTWSTLPVPLTIVYEKYRQSRSYRVSFVTATGREVVQL